MVSGSAHSPSGNTALFQRFSEVETATLGHFRVDGFMAPGIQCLLPGIRICGRALTVALPADDGAMLAHAISLAGNEDILVVDRLGDDRHACWGEVLTAAAQVRGVLGAIIDGFITDLAAIQRAQFPIWCRGRSPVTTKLRGIGGAVNATVSCGGTTVCPGDIILADENGVAVLPPADAFDLAERAIKMQAAEPETIARLRAGELLEDISGARALLDAANNQSNRTKTNNN